ncbi:hypothetical protein L2E82_16306 [Cichorium intybus]|uniref:Uncharacterized protein n=1 Tax=Cichorium intybus TaxID=13427 RepID=A0ACB9F4I7_CICIN|nr:hypothetical protein L2E82_16306 [Cichorium intybus]
MDCRWMAPEAFIAVGKQEDLESTNGDELYTSVSEDVEINSLPDLQYQVSSNGWAEGECQGKAGWFPLQYVERRQNISNSFVAK